MAKLKITKEYTNPNGTVTQVDTYVSPTLINGAHYGGTGGETSQSGRQLKISYYNGGLQTGYITAQKGEKKFRVNNTSNASTTTATLVNLQPSELSVANTAVIIANAAIFTGANLANIGTGGGGYTNNRAYAYVTWTAANVAGYATPVVGYQLTGNSGFVTGNATIVAINSATNVTVALSTTQTVTGNTTGRIQVYEQFAAKTISNKFVNDWANTKWRYRFSAPYTDGVTVLASQPTWQGNTMVQVESVN